MVPGAGVPQFSYINYLAGRGSSDLRITFHVFIWPIDSLFRHGALLSLLTGLSEL